MTRPPRRPPTASARGVVRPIVRAVVGVAVTLLLIGLAFGVLPHLQESPLRDPIVRVIVENRSDLPMERVRFERCADEALLASTDSIAHGGHFEMTRPAGEQFTWRLTFTQSGRTCVFDDLRLAPTYAELQVVTVTPGPCVDGERGDLPTPR